MRTVIVISLMLILQMAVSKCPIKSLEGKWAGTFESNDGVTWAIVVNILKTEYCGFQGKIHWIDNFNTHISIEGKIDETGSGIFEEIDIIQGINSQLGSVFKFNLVGNGLNGKSEFNKKIFGTFDLSKWEHLSSETIESFEEIIKISETKYGVVKIGSNIPIDQKSFFQKYLAMTNGDQFYYESMLEWKTIITGNYKAKEFVAAKRGKYFHKETWSETEYLNGHIDTIQWSYDPSKDEVIWEKYTMDELGDNRFIDGLGQMGDAEIVSSRRAWIDSQEYIRLELLKNEVTLVFYVNPETMKVHRLEYPDKVYVWKDYQFYQKWLIPKHYIIQYQDSKYEYTIDSLFFDRPISDDIFAIPDFVRKRLITSKIKRPQDFYGASQSAFNKHDFKEALRQIDLAINYDAKNSLYYVYRGKIKTALNDKYGALSDFSSAISLNSKETEAYNSRGIIKYNLKDYNSAITDFKAANLSDHSHATSLYNIGYTFLQLKEYDSADFYVKNALKLDSANTTYWINLGVINYNRKDYKSAIYAYKTAIEFGANDPSIFNKFGVVLYLNANYDSAKIAFKQALTNEPTSYQYLINLGNTLNQLQECEEAIAIYEKALEIEDKKDHDVINKLGLCYYKLEDYDYAIVLFSKAIGIKSLAQYYDNRAYSKSNTMDYQGAIEDFGMSIQLDPSDSNIWFERGKLKQLQHNNFDACSDFKKARELGHQEAEGLMVENCR